MEVSDPVSAPSGRTTSTGGVERGARSASLLPFVLLTGVLLVGLAVDATASSAHLFGLEGPKCPSTYVLGATGCPGCGLTRSTALILHGQFATASRLQPAAWVVVVLAAAGSLLHGFVLVTGEKTAWIDRLLRTGRVLFVAGLLLAWLVRLA